MKRLCILYSFCAIITDEKIIKKLTKNLDYNIDKGIMKIKNGVDGDVNGA